MVREKILVVDDEEAIRWTLTESLRGWGYTPVECEKAGAALAAWEANKTAAVLLDINLPDGSGLDVLREIKRRRPDEVVIMITANVLVDQTIAALRYGAYDFISKPISLEELQVPSDYVAQKGFAFGAGDQIEVTGSKVKFAGGDVLVAREIRKGDKVLTLRNRRGIPAWSRGGRRL